jgi:NitT/TauT family transport system permease protein
MSGQIKPVWARLVVLAALLLLWEIGGRIGSQLFISPPSKVIFEGTEIFHDPQVLQALSTTAWEIAAGFALALAIGILLGLTVAGSRFTYSTFYPVLLLVYGIPQITILPLFVLYFGSGPASKIAFGVSHGLFPVAISVVAGVQGIRPLLLQSAKSMGATRWQMFRRITLPHLIPNLFTGMRLGVTATLLGVLLGELYVSAGGIGHFARQFSETFQPEKLFALVAALALMAVLLNECMRQFEVRQSVWREA